MSGDAHLERQRGAREWTGESRQRPVDWHVVDRFDRGRPSAHPRSCGPGSEDQVLGDQPIVSHADGAARDAKLRGEIPTGWQTLSWRKPAVEDCLSEARVYLVADWRDGGSVHLDG
ncbi:hypothetical protein LMG1866_04462 [Achromobacter ruhlandii]|nr:hypothetical protein LMG1866_04462 [Achromobacter ruhlandii]